MKTYKLQHTVTTTPDFNNTNYFAKGVKDFNWFSFAIENKINADDICLNSVISCLDAFISLGLNEAVFVTYDLNKSV